MDKKITQIVKKYSELVKEVADVEMIILYGSAAKGTMHEYSDIDVAVIMDDYKGNYLTLSTKLVELIHKVDIRIEPTLLLRKHDRSGFIDTVLREGKIIYSAN